jgi:hypothetical protein
MAARRSNISKSNGSRHKLAAGARATVRFGSSTMPVEVVEDRGRVGYQGAHVVRVRVIDENVPDSETFEVVADDLKLASARG